MRAGRVIPSRLPGAPALSIPGRIPAAPYPPRMPPDPNVRSPDGLYDLGVVLLDAIVAEFGNDGVAVPARRYVHFGEVVDECDQLVVAFQRLFIGVAGLAETPVPITHGISRVALWEVRISRCLRGVPEGAGLDISAPGYVDTTDLDADAHAALRDAYTLHRAIVRAKFNSEVRGFCEAISLGPVQPYISGGIGAMRCEVTTEVS